MRVSSSSRGRKVITGQMETVKGLEIEKLEDLGGKRNLRRKVRGKVEGCSCGVDPFKRLLRALDR